MKSPYVSELEPNQTITGTFLVHHKDIRQKKSGEPYLSLTLADRTGELDAKMWDNAAEVLDTFDRDDFVRVKGLLQVFQNRPQLTVHKLLIVADSEVDFADYFPASKRDRDEMFLELRGWIASIVNPHLRALLESIFADEAVALAFRTAPAAKSVHHAWLGGLIEHVLSLCHLAKFAAAHYTDVDADLLLSGVILHDIGKIRELTYHRGFGYSTEGQLLGHIMIGARMVEDKLRGLPDFPAPLSNLLLHMILSHHGELEFGSPKVPLFAEAVLLHHLDNLDSKMEIVRGLVERDRLIEGVWTGYSAPLDRSVLKKRKFLEPTSPTPAPAPTPPNAGPAGKPAFRPAASPFASKLQNALRHD
jgi:3'-5' exoribonuclease